MSNKNIYHDIAQRTGGDIYIGVVGPVRTGKSTLIKKIMELLVLPNIIDPYDKERAKDELPQSSGGRTVMTTEPKFIPDEAVSITVDEGSSIRIKLIDCVGYVVPDALGQIEDGAPRMVHTPWQKEPMPFIQAAEIGTKKVITDHSTIGLVVTCDGSVCDLGREQYLDAEEKVIRELKSMKKPFAIVLNSADPNSEKAVALALELEEKHGAPVALINALDINADDIRHILDLILHEFPISEISFKLPDWTSALDSSHEIIRSIEGDIMSCGTKISKMGQIRPVLALIGENPYVLNARLEGIDMGTGKIRVTLELDHSLYYKVMSELTGLTIKDEEDLIRLIRELSDIKTKYDRISEALADVEEKGYGIVMPDKSSLSLEEPKIVRQPGGYGVKLKASAPSIHMIKADIETEINPVVGTEAQSEELVRYLLSSFESDPAKIWETNMFGRTLYDLVTDGLQAKLKNMPEDSRTRLCETLGRIINEGSGGLICIIL